jgi:hypothetical protein
MVCRKQQGVFLPALMLDCLSLFVMPIIGVLQSVKCRGVNEQFFRQSSLMAVQMSIVGIRYIGLPGPARLSPNPKERILSPFLAGENVSSLQVF